MTIIRRAALIGAILAGAAIAWTQVALTTAAPMPKVGISYQTSGGQPIDNTNYRIVADMVVPAGKYHISARGTVTNQTGAAVDYVACDAYAGVNFVDSGTASAPLQYAGFAIDGQGDLPSGGTIRVECISSVPAGQQLPLAGINVVADSMAGLSTLP
jgi:hypothetical protein